MTTKTSTENLLEEDLIRLDDMLYPDEGEPQLPDLELVRKLYLDCRQLRDQINHPGVYCPQCGACGVEGCCPPGKCGYVIQYQKQYDDVIAENQMYYELLDRVTENPDISPEFLEEIKKKVWPPDGQKPEWGRLNNVVPIPVK